MKSRRGESSGGFLLCVRDQGVAKPRGKG